MSDGSSFLVEVDDRPPKLAERMPPEPWYYGFLVLYANAWLWGGTAQFLVVVVVLATNYERFREVALGALAGSIGIAAACALVAAPILLMVDGARNLRAMRWRR